MKCLKCVALVVCVLGACPSAGEPAGGVRELLGGLARGHGVQRLGSQMKDAREREQVEDAKPRLLGGGAGGMFVESLSQLGKALGGLSAQESAGAGGGLLQALEAASAGGGPGGGGGGGGGKLLQALEGASAGGGGGEWDYRGTKYIGPAMDKVCDSRGCKTLADFQPSLEGNPRVERARTAGENIGGRLQNVHDKTVGDLAYPGPKRMKFNERIYDIENKIARHWDKSLPHDGLVMSVVDGVGGAKLIGEEEGGHGDGHGDGGHGEHGDDGHGDGEHGDDGHGDGGH